MILTFDSLNKYRIYSVDNTLVKNFHIVKFVIGIWLAIFRSVDNCVFFIPHIRRLAIVTYFAIWVIVQTHPVANKTYLTQDAIKNQINKVVGGKNGQRFISAIVSAYNTNPTLQECTNQSILSAALLGEK